MSECCLCLPAISKAIVIEYDLCKLLPEEGIAQDSSDASRPQQAGATMGRYMKLMSVIW
jgi:hypothetical protein